MNFVPDAQCGNVSMLARDNGTSTEQCRKQGAEAHVGDVRVRLVVQLPSLRVESKGAGWQGGAAERKQEFGAFAAGKGNAPIAQLGHGEVGARGHWKWQCTALQGWVQQCTGRQLEQRGG